MATTAEAFVEDADPSGTHRSGNSHGFSLSHRERTRVSPFPAGCDTDSRASAATRSLDGSLSAEGDRVPRRLVEPAHRLSLFFGTSQAGSLYSRTASQCPHKIRGRAYGYPARVTGADPSCGGNWARCSHLSAAFWLARGGVTHPCTLSGSSTGKELRHPTERIVRAPFTIRSPGLADTALHNYGKQNDLPHPPGFVRYLCATWRRV